MQKGRSAPWQFGDENRPIDDTGKDCRIVFLCCIQPQQIVQATHHVEANRAAAEAAEVRFLLIGFQKPFQWLDERWIGKSPAVGTT
jgi:hypothetical protein